MKKQTLKEHYEVPTSVKVELLADSGIMQMSDPLTMSAITPIDDLGITDTDAGSAIWY